MEIPASFQTAIASKLYTDVIRTMNQVEELDSEGGVKKGATTASASYGANVQPLDAELKKALLGESIEADYRVTTTPTIPADKGSLIEYGELIYEVMDFKRYNSHAELLIKRWMAP